MGLLIEVLMVGLATAVVGFCVSTVFMYIFANNFSFKKYHFWWQVFLSYFITGCLIHLICEATGVNKWYCKNGAACN